MAALQELDSAILSADRMPTVFQDKVGQIVGINKKRIYETPFFINTNPPQTVVPIKNGSTSKAASLRVSAEGPMQILELGARRDDANKFTACNVVLTIQDGASAHSLMNAPCHIDAIFGPGGQMYPLPEGLYIDENRALSAVFTDLVPTTGAPPQPAKKVQITGSAAKYNQITKDPTLARIKQRLQTRQFLSMPYWYTFDNGSVTLSPLGYQEVTLEIGFDHHFEIHQMSIVSDGEVAVNIIDLTKGESIINAPSNGNYPVNSRLWFGQGGYPYRLHEPITIFTTQSLMFQLQDLSGIPYVAGDARYPGNKVYLVLGGRRITVKDWE